jgi:hypothetical protein
MVRDWFFDDVVSPRPEFCEALDHALAFATTSVSSLDRLD